MEYFHSRLKIKEKRYKHYRWLECYSMKLDLLTNATVVDDAIRFVSEKSAAAVANAEPKINLHVEQKKQQQKITTKESKNQIIILPP